MSFLEIMLNYFRGEELEALWFILPVSILLQSFGAVALKTERGGFAWGVAIPCILFGLVFMGTGIGVGRRTKGQVAELEQTFQKSPATMVLKELPRMEKVNANFKSTFMVFGVLAAVGLAVHYLGGHNWLGPGIGCCFDSGQRHFPAG